ncbi:hypothetical protein JXA70_20050 [candidate division KSB1 bacterium]|nr:hypothetical protein [candidate division KSB1 bacterium]
MNGTYVELDGERCYRIEHYDQMPPFFMSIVSDSDHWMFISSTGALTAGRINPDNALFPYYTDDRIHDSADQTGSKTIILLTAQNKTFLWEPFSHRGAGLYSVQRNIYKNMCGNKIFFKEINHDLGVTFCYAWLNSEKFGFIKRSTIVNIGETAVRINLVDGIQNILPYGIDRRFQLEYSTLADGYKKNELLPETGLALYRLSSIPTDKAEPSEALKVTTAWSVGAETAKKLLSARQLDIFRTGQPIEQEIDVRAARGAYFANLDFSLAPKAEKQWLFAADINKDSTDVVNLNNLIREGKSLRDKILQDVQTGTENLMRIVANADGLQKTGDELLNARHYSNVLFNVMRGGIFENDYWVSKSDFIDFVKTANKVLATASASFFAALPERLNYAELLAICTGRDNPRLEKLCYEYMPLTFGRRHGDPSRPWNIFAINIKDEHGNKILNYQGNWRDIFQNWEALALSFPEYIESMIAKFVNASTVDGYNPYRVTRDGFDWEELDPHDAWSYIGYWGDHQIIYVLKLLELSAHYHPGKLEVLLNKAIYSYANVPYRIKSYEQLLNDPHNTIDFDYALAELVKARVQEIGADGKFVWDKKEQLHQVTLAEKLLVTLLCKLVNFIPEAGIWMNTQRPEWNDANNALVGYGVSMVTLYYLRRFIAFCRQLFRGASAYAVSKHVAELLTASHNTFVKYLGLLNGRMSDKDRKKICDELGTAGSVYRQAVYAGVAEVQETISAARLFDFFETALKYVDHSISANKRQDNLYHAYNLIDLKKETEISIRTLYEMLEGQVAVLSAGLFSPDDAVSLLDALRHSSLYRKDQNSYMLYPDRELPRFIEKNTLPAEVVESSELLQMMLREKNRSIVTHDTRGNVHFNGAFRNARLLRQALEKMPGTPYEALAEQEKQALLDLYEKMFDHQSFTGRSGTFYKYEGLGSIYWHMVSKLLYAVAEIYHQAVQSGADKAVLTRLADHYFNIREGIGVHKSPEQYGAFPTDPYSHTPGFAGAQQPGMTGQVKEDILSRYLELGCVVADGVVFFSGELLKKADFTAKAELFRYYDVFGEQQEIDLPHGCLAYTLCQVPVIYHDAEFSRIELTFKDGSTVRQETLALDGQKSQMIYNRTGEIRRIDVYLAPFW